jgi:hypothetical protein
MFAHASPKLTKEEVSFEHPAKGPRHCEQCVHFQPGQDSCKIVSGKIEPGDWCEKWLKR